MGAYRASGGLLGHRAGGMTFLLLHTTGARTGRPRTTPLLYVAGGAPALGAGAVAVAASNGGSPHHPGWLHNLRHAPHAEVTLGRERRRVHAREAAPHERAALWAALDAAYPYAPYRARAGREIPIVVLEPEG